MRSLLTGALLAAAVLGVTGCATTARDQEVLAAWMGADVNDLVDVWGRPTEWVREPSGRSRLIYDDRVPFMQPWGVGPGLGGGVYGHDAYLPWCRVEFEADASGRLIRWVSEGSRCEPRPPAETTGRAG